MTHREKGFVTSFARALSQEDHLSDSLQDHQAYRMVPPHGYLIRCSLGPL
jgi:hypothetical protein